MVLAHSSSKELGARKMTSLAPPSVSFEVRIKKYLKPLHFIPQFVMKWSLYRQSVYA